MKSASFSLRRRLGRTLAMLLAVVLGTGLATFAVAVLGHRGRVEAQSFHAAARATGRIGQLAREQYIHEAHTILLEDPSHLAHHDGWVAELHREIAGVRAVAPSEQDVRRLDLLASDSAELSRLFSESIIPAVEAGDRSATRKAHVRAARLVEEMTDTADALGVDLDRRAAAAEAEAARQAWVLSALVAIIAAATTLFSLFVARRLWRAVSEPLGELARLADRVGAGDHDARLGHSSTEEIQPVAHAFDEMLDALARKEKDLREADRLAAIGRVAAGIAHEMNNPLGVIRGYVKTMGRETEDARLRADLATIDGEAEICERIVQDLLTYARTPALVRANVDAADLAREAAAKLRSPLSEPLTADIEVEVEPASLLVDPIRLRQVLVNLLRNALQAAPNGPVSLEGAAKGGTEYEFVVRDGGSGLSHEAREHLFEPFFTTRGDGTGLGLAVSFGLVTAHGGTISAVGQEDGGTAFHVKIPVRPPSQGRDGGDA